MRTLAVALLWSLLAAHVAAPPPPIERLAGIWEGTEKTVQTGSCAWAGGPMPTRIVIQVGADGRLQGGISPLPAPGLPTPTLSISVSEKKVRVEHERTK